MRFRERFSNKGVNKDQPGIRGEYALDLGAIGELDPNLGLRCRKMTITNMKKKDRFSYVFNITR